VPLELLVWNNSRRVRLEAARGSEVGELLCAFPDVKVFNSDHNWLCRIRYTIATLARHDTILFLDDDLAPTDAHLVRDLYGSHPTSCVPSTSSRAGPRCGRAGTTPRSPRCAWGSPPRSRPS
jgi:hypothetical protein